MYKSVAATLSLFLLVTPVVVLLGQQQGTSQIWAPFSPRGDTLLSKWGFRQNQPWAPASIKQQVSEGTHDALALVRQGWEWIAPGGKLHPKDFLEVYQGHIIIEGILGLVIAYLFFQSSYRWSKKKTNIESLTEEEIDQLCEEWKPEPLFESIRETKVKYEAPVLTSPSGKTVNVDGKEVLNMAAYNFLGIAGNKDITDKCHAAIEKYGVGACGPRGFYGTIDVHLDLEKRLAEFMGTEEAIIYAYDLTTLPSLLPAFANAKDLIITDERADYGIQNGCNLSRARVVKFKHNDMEDLERVVQSEIEKHNKLKKPLNRRFIVVEGIYKASGDLAPLDKIAEIKKKYKFRLVVDESFSFGVLGQNGKGACEHFGLTSADVEVVCSSMGNAMASVGGFCAGSREIVDHQRLSGLGYCFSAALPPYLATASIGALDIMQEEFASRLQPALRENAKYLHKAVQNIPGLRCLAGKGDELSPVVHLELVEPAGDYETEQEKLQHVVEECLEKSAVLITVNKVSALDLIRLPASIRVVVTSAHDEKDIDRTVAAIQQAAKSILV